MMKHDKLRSSRFITIEGGEGAGKSTLIKSLEAALRARGVSVLTTREPGGTLFGERVRQWLLAHDMTVKIGAKAELLLFLSARAQHLEEVIIPALASGSVVICDRFNDSTIAYQGGGRGLGVEWVRSLCSMVCGNTVPDLTLYLDIDPHIGLERTRHLSKEYASAGEKDRIEIEKLDFHQRVRQTFVNICRAEPGRFHCIDTNQLPEVVLEEALKVIDRV